MKTNIQRVWMNATVVQSAQWKDGECGEESNGYAIFTVQNVPYVWKLGAKPFNLQVMYFGKSGRSAVSCLTAGLEVSLDGQLILNGQNFVLVASSVEFLGRNYIDEFYRNIEQVELPSQKQQMQVEKPKKTEPKQTRHFLFFNEVMQAVGCKLEKGSFQKWLNQYGYTLTDVAVRLFPQSTKRESARYLLRDRIFGKNRWARGDLDKLYAILAKIQQEGIVHTIPPVEEDKKDVRPECELVKVFLTEHEITCTEVTKRFYALEIKNGRFKNRDSALATFCKYLRKDLFTSDQLRKIMQIAQDLVDEKSKKPALDPASSFAGKINLANKTNLPVLVEGENGEPVMTEARSSPRPPRRLSTIYEPPIPTYSALEALEELKRDDEGENGKPVVMETRSTPKSPKRVSVVGKPPIPTFSALEGQREEEIVYDEEYMYE